MSEKKKVDFNIEIPDEFEDIEVRDCDEDVFIIGLGSNGDIIIHSRKTLEILQKAIEAALYPKKEEEKLIFKEPDLEHMKLTPETLKEIEAFHKRLEEFLKNTKRIDLKVLQKPFDI